MDHEEKMQAMVLLKREGIHSYQNDYSRFLTSEKTAVSY
jgi:hypothetical protein